MSAASTFEGARAVADAVLYEGYLLYPYRRSSAKNRMRWQFGVLAPEPWLPASVREDTSVAGSADAWRQRTECLIQVRSRDSATLTVCVRFLQMQHRRVEQRTEAGYVPVDALDVSGVRFLTFDEAVPREHECVVELADLREAAVVAEIEVPGGEEIEQLEEVGRIVRVRRPLRAVVSLSATPIEAVVPLFRLRLEIRNAAEAPASGAPRAEALAVSLIATHSLLGVTGGRFVSLLDPPGWAEEAAKGCRNIHTFPVLAGAPDAWDVVLSAPILMEDHPRVSPESPGDLFDATEIDEILSLRTLTLTDEEKREARATDPRAAEIIDRVETMPPEVLGRLHGTIRTPRPASAAAERAWWEPGGDDAVNPATDHVLVDGVRVGRGDRVRLNPRRHGTDVHDMFLVGRTARVEAVLTDVDGTRYVAVSIEDDPGADLHGRHYHFTPEELTALGGKREAGGSTALGGEREPLDPSVLDGGLGQREVAG